MKPKRYLIDIVTDNNEDKSGFVYAQFTEKDIRTSLKFTFKDKVFIFTDDSKAEYKFTEIPIPFEDRESKTIEEACKKFFGELDYDIKRDGIMET